MTRYHNHLILHAGLDPIASQKIANERTLSILLRRGYVPNPSPRAALHRCRRE
jgi:hypothetical protein